MYEAPAALSQPDPPSARDRSVSNAEVLAIALPIMLSNATVPLIGFADAAVIGQLGEAHLLGAVAMAATIFNVLYYIFVFLRMGTTGLTAQATGANDGSEIAATLARALIIAVSIGAVMVALQGPIATTSVWLLGASERVAPHTQTYVTIRIWAAPAGLANLAMLGWFIGLGRAAVAFYLQLFLNGLNIALALLFVLVLEWGVAGVATAACTAEITAAVVGFLVARRELRRRNASTTRYALTQLSQLKRLFAVSRDILIRTACLQLAIGFFVSQGARDSDVTLATNAVLFNLVMIAIYMVDGFAYAAETLVGQAIGARRRERYRDAIRLATRWALAAAVLLSLTLWLAGTHIVAFMTTSPEVRAAAHVYLMWAALVPLTAVWCFLLDAVFIGATATATMRNMMLIALAVYFAVWAVAAPTFGNHGLWIALHALFIARGITLGLALPGLGRKLFAEKPAPPVT
jgi:MATE family multidrug resistance protein